MDVATRMRRNERMDRVRTHHTHAHGHGQQHMDMPRTRTRTRTRTHTHTHRHTHTHTHTHTSRHDTTRYDTTSHAYPTRVFLVSLARDPTFDLLAGNRTQRSILTILPTARPIAPIRAPTEAIGRQHKQQHHVACTCVCHMGHHMT